MAPITESFFIRLIRKERGNQLCDVRITWGESFNAGTGYSHGPNPTANPVSVNERV
jgi:hypothetical protein